MGDVVQFPAAASTPDWDRLAAHPLRSPSTPARQTGQPGFLFHFPDGSMHLRTTPTGFKALEALLAEDPDFPLKLTRHPSSSQPIEAVGALPVQDLGDVLSLTPSLAELLVLHVYQCRESRTVPYQRSFRRLTPGPRSAPEQRYLWTVDFGVHGGTWLFGTARDLEEAYEVGKELGLVRFTHAERIDITGELQCLALESRRRDVLLNALAARNFWLRREQAWCDCHES